MNRQHLSMGLLLIVVAGMSGGAGYWIAHRQPVMSTTGMTTSTERKIMYWYDPMKPDQHFDKPGKSPFMDMELVPRYADESGNAAGEAGGVTIDSALTQNLGVRLAKVESGTLSQPLAAPASVVFNERDVAVVQTRTTGFVERVYARAPGDVVAQGAPLLDLLVPEWAGAQAEFLAIARSGDADLVRAARERLRLLGMPETTIQRIEKSGEAQTLFTVTAPIAGVIQSLDIRQGMTVSSGMTIARLNGLSTVWMEAAVPEAEGSLVTPGESVAAQLAAYPGKTFVGHVIAVLPEVNIQTRTVRVRMEFPNRGQQLRPGMFAQVKLDGGKQAETLLIPTEALISTGKRNIVIVAEDKGSFRPVEVAPGAQAEGKTAILAGLKAGENVVVSGQFLIDSEASLKGVLAQMKTATESPADAMIKARGIIEAISAQEMTLSHDAIPALEWPAMTMSFALDKATSTQGLKKGQRVEFALEKRGDDLVIVRLRTMEGM
ncbi:MAG: efflux RND transporter periplasmic adaptor subunit [bacterium]|nr:efflux RND transporter periplasmic adaptor subunit [bacterium]